MRDQHGAYAGIVTARVVAEAMSDGQEDRAPLSLVLELPMTLHDDDPLEQAIEALDKSGCAAIPVIARCDEAVVGWIDYQTSLRGMQSR